MLISSTFECTSTDNLELSVSFIINNIEDKY